MGMMINRRRAYGGKSVPPYLPDYTLIFHWEASDGLVNSKWVDRIGGYSFSIVNNAPQLINGMFKVRRDNCFGGNLNTDIPINMGDVWQIDIEFIIDALPSDEKIISVADFGSIYNSNHAFGFMLSKTGVFSFNPKLKGNTSSSLYKVSIPFTTYGMLCKASIGMEKINSNTYLPYYILNGVRYDSPNTTTAEGATFNCNFNDNTLRIGSGREFSACSNDWQYIKSIKIYKKN